MFSRNSASSRAIPTSKLIERVEREPAVPLEWGRNKPGMSASEELSQEEAADGLTEWLCARDHAVAHAKRLLEFGVHKQILNRLLEPFMWHTVIVTATEWANFFYLRTGATAQPEIRQAAERMREALRASQPGPVEHGSWHLPLIQADERDLALDTRKKISAARCARVSYLTHTGTRDVAKDIELCERLMSDGHLSPFEHVATPSDDASECANFVGWMQLRRTVEATALFVS